MLAEGLSLIAGEDDVGVVHPAQAAHRPEELANAVVNVTHGPGVGAPEQEHLGLADHFTDRAGRHVDQGRNILDVNFVAGLLG